jgi:geranylgeranylglycerol-phosphate geranylgeranyltransferase
MIIIYKYEFNINKRFRLNRKETMKEGKLKEYAKLIRLPSSIGLSVIAVIGALSVKGANLEILPFILLLLMGVIFNVFGFVLNDYMDVEIDGHSKELDERPLVKGTVSSRAALMTVISCLIILFTIPLIFFSVILPILILIVSVILAIFYDTFSKKLVGSEVFLSGAMASFCLFGAVAVSDNIRDLHEVGALTWVVVAVMFIYVFIMNVLEGNLKDVENDRKAGAVTLPVYLGVKTTGKMYVPMCLKVLIICLKSILVVLIFIPFIFMGLMFWFWQVLLLMILAIGMLWSMMKILNERLYDKEKLGRYGRRHGVLSYFVFPFMLVGFIGGTWAIFLILYPALWPLIFNYVLYGKSLTPAAYIK